MLTTRPAKLNVNGTIRKLPTVYNKRTSKPLPTPFSRETDRRKILERDKEKQVSSSRTIGSKREDFTFTDSSVLHRQNQVELTKNKEMNIQRNRNILVGPQNQET